ncbi:hypothetical protein [Litoribaculum gwangyangense]|uniref:Response regulatory domain-containing protein n=1 Tax=Litoribaculum gwangyangense TaxID=1130722 RepID=A0ABP9C1W6_9FLAO
MSKKYNILWIDDEHDDDALLTFILLAENQEIILHGYSNFKEGFSALTTNINFYDAVLLDALFFEDETSQTPNPAGLGSALKKLNELVPKKVFPYFVLSGQTHFTDVTNPILEAFQLRCYNKKNPDDVQELLKNIKIEADQQIDLQIKHENQKLFDILENYPDKSRDTFMAIFKGMRGLDFNFSDDFTSLRKILEILFRMTNAVGLLHDYCVQKGADGVNLSESSLFLSGKDTKHLKVRCTKTHFPKIISENVKNIIFITGAASHTTTLSSTETVNIQAYRNKVNTPYLLYSLALQLMDVLIWFDSYIKENGDVEKNKSFWEEIEIDINEEDYEITEIYEIQPNGWGTVYINTVSIGVHPRFVTSLNLVAGDTIKFTIDDNSKAQNITKL